jgi:hypothetical protein
MFVYVVKLLISPAADPGDRCLVANLLLHIEDVFNIVVVLFVKGAFPSNRTNKAILAWCIPLFPQLGDVHVEMDKLE